MSDRPDYTEVRVGDDQRCLIVWERDDPELVAIAVCMTALRDLDANAAARVAAFVAERHPLTLDERRGGVS